ncbi:MAG: formate dehydrogenase accessory sulfurtransferase FdhD [Planctomycetota bacterium]|nr:formate dehydrogenase accessory sulfurtransferase FdhD [Planctomycetota bacterium]
MDPRARDRQPAPGAARRRLACGRDDLLIEEAPLLLDIHGHQLLTMRTPGADGDLARGFLLGEGIASSLQEVVAVAELPPTVRAPASVRVELQAAPAGLAKARLARTHEIRSSCGACGIADPDALLDDAPALLPGTPRLPAAQLATLTEALAQRQALFAQTGGCHGAVIADADGAVVAASEDVGRHNALDKAIGAAARAGVDLAQCVAVLSGRAGFDLVVKCLRVRIPIIVSVSAPSALAFDLCAAAGATLVGFARGEQRTVYCGADRLV